MLTDDVLLSQYAGVCEEYRHMLRANRRKRWLISAVVVFAMAGWLLISQSMPERLIPGLIAIIFVGVFGGLWLCTRHDIICVRMSIVRGQFRDMLVELGIREEFIEAAGKGEVVAIRPFVPSNDPDAAAGCARPDCPAGGGSGEGCAECNEWWDGEKRRVR